MRKLWFVALLFAGCGAAEAPPPDEPVPAFEEKPAAIPANADPNAPPPPKTS